MTKAELKANNALVLRMLDEADDFLSKLEHRGRWLRFRHCTASYQPNRDESRQHELFLLCSYDTIVALVAIDRETNRYTCVDFLRYVYGYTSTSAQHISKFFYDFADTPVKKHGGEVIRYRYETERG